MTDQPHMKTSYSPTRLAARERARRRRQALRRVRIGGFAAALICAVFATASLASGTGARSHKVATGASRIGVIAAPVKRGPAKKAPARITPAKAALAAAPLAAAALTKAATVKAAPSASAKVSTRSLPYAGSRAPLPARSLPYTGSRAPLLALLLGGVLVMFGMLMQAAGAPARARR